MGRRMPQGQRLDNVLQAIGSTLAKLESSGILAEVVLPQADKAYAELPFVIEHGGDIYNGRIDRVIIRDNTVFVYDYKCFPVRQEEEPRLIEQYTHQMSLYARAAEGLFKLKTRALIVLANEGKVLEVAISP
ncbi:MAG TPA: hypothetical protein ENI12_04070 [Nitrospirae bacterium]|nr:hypothetical protein [Nitrospirota bacterium]